MEQQALVHLQPLRPVGLLLTSTRPSAILIQSRLQKVARPSIPVRGYGRPLGQPYLTGCTSVRKHVLPNTERWLPCLPYQQGLILREDQRCPANGGTSPSNRPRNLLWGLRRISAASYGIALSKQEIHSLPEKPQVSTSPSGFSYSVGNATSVGALSQARLNIFRNACARGGFSMTTPTGIPSNATP